MSTDLIIIANKARYTALINSCRTRGLVAEAEALEFLLARCAALTKRLHEVKDKAK
jgi:hypothetical protein